jgi:hypothetical protein
VSRGRYILPAAVRRLEEGSPHFQLCWPRNREIKGEFPPRSAPLRRNFIQVNVLAVSKTSMGDEQATIRIKGSAGPGVAENMMSGTVIIDGNASQYAGATGRGGLLVVKGNASSRCGVSMKGIDIVVHGSIGHMSAFMAQRGGVRGTLASMCFRSSVSVGVIDVEVVKLAGGAVAAE